MTGLNPDGPAVVAVGGGHGLARTLTAVREYAGSITAIVSAADDGFSSGRIRAQLAIPAPGDMRRCLMALADADRPLTHAFEHRFTRGELAGHAMGNLVIAGLTESLGDMAAAIDEAGALLGCVGRVMPASPAMVELLADTASGVVSGQVAVANTAGIRRVRLDPSDPPPAPGATDAIAAAEQVVLGPGSLYTSILAAVAVPAVGAALGRAAAQVVYVANLEPQISETEGMTVADHVAAIEAHGVRPTAVLADPEALPLGDLDDRFVAAPLAATGGHSHDPKLLAAALGGLT